jgi:hypothetical protein
MAHYCLQGKARVRMTELLMKLKADPFATNKWGEKPADLVGKKAAKESEEDSGRVSPCGVADMNPDAENADSPKKLSAGTKQLCAEAPCFVPLAVKAEMEKTGMVYENGHFYFFSGK